MLFLILFPSLQFLSEYLICSKCEFIWKLLIVWHLITQLRTIPNTGLLWLVCSFLVRILSKLVTGIQTESCLKSIQSVRYSDHGLDIKHSSTAHNFTIWILDTSTVGFRFPLYSFCRNALSWLPCFIYLHGHSHPSIGDNKIIWLH